MSPRAATPAKAPRRRSFEKLRSLSKADGPGGYPADSETWTGLT